MINSASKQWGLGVVVNRYRQSKRVKLRFSVVLHFGPWRLYLNRTADKWHTHDPKLDPALKSLADRDTRTMSLLGDHDDAR